MIRIAAAAWVAFSFAQFSSAQAADTVPAACNLELVNTQTDFPIQSQADGEHGLVRVQLKVDATGRATDVAVARSSGFHRLDQAAVSSVRKYWRFNVAHCASGDLALNHTVDVTFRNTSQHTVAGTLDHKSLAQAKLLTANDQCHQTVDEAGNPIFACIKGAGDEFASTVGKTLAR
jgi:TonB family protein